MKKIFILLVLAVAACINTAAQSDPVMRVITDYRRETAKMELAEQQVKRVASRFGYEPSRDYEFDMTTTIRYKNYRYNRCCDLIADNVRVIVDDNTITIYGTEGMVACYSRFSDIGTFKFDGVVCGKYSNAQLVIINSAASTQLQIRYGNCRSYSKTVLQPKRYKTPYGVGHRSTSPKRY